MKVLRNMIAASVALAATSCFMIAPTGTYVTSYKLIPGESLLGSELEYICLEDPTTADGRFVFSFNMDIDEGTYEKVSGKVYASSRQMPSDSLFSSLENRRKVKSEFKKIYDSFTESYIADFPEDVSKDGFDIMTLLYDGGMSLTADKEFAGYPAGWNLAPKITGTYYRGVGTDPIISHVNNTSDKSGGYLDIQMDYISMTQSYIGFSIPIDGMELTDETITFTLDIPVKVVMYLNWLDDRIDNPDAPVPYKDVVLHCRFKTEHGMRYKIIG